MAALGSIIALPGWAYTALAILGLGVVTLVARGFFLWPDRERRVPERLMRAMQVAPLAALFAITAPEVFLSHGQLIATWRDARLLGAVAATAVYAWRGGVLGPMVGGLSVYLPLRLAMGW